LARGGRPRGRARGGSKVGRRRSGANARSAVLGMLVHIFFDLAADTRELLAMNRGKPGGRYLLSETTAVAVAVARDLSRMSYRKIAGALAEATGGACTVTHSQVWRRVAALGLDDVAEHVRRRGIRVVRAGDARIMLVLNRHGTLTVTARRGEAVMVMVVHGADPVELGPGRAAARDAARRAARAGMFVVRTVGRMTQADAIVFDGTTFAAYEADEHRRIRHEGGIRRRKGHKVFVAVALGPGERIRVVATATAHENAGDAPSFVPLAEAAVACGALRPGTRVYADKAYATREIIAWCAAHGARAVIPVRINSSGKSMGSMEWRRHVVANLVPKEMRRRFMRGGDIQSLPLEVRVAAQRVWMEENDYGRRSAVEYTIGALKKTFGGHVSARRPDLVAHEIARKAIVYNAGCP